MQAKERGKVGKVGKEEKDCMICLFFLQKHNSVQNTYIFWQLPTIDWIIQNPLN